MLQITYKIYKRGIVFETKMIKPDKVWLGILIAFLSCTRYDTNLHYILPTRKTENSGYVILTYLLPIPDTYLRKTRLCVMVIVITSYNSGIYYRFEIN